jgi:hypothetical protein
MLHLDLRARNARPLCNRAKQNFERMKKANPAQPRLWRAPQVKACDVDIEQVYRVHARFNVPPEQVSKGG